MFSLDTNVLRHSVMVAPDILAVIVEVRILLSQQILILKLTKITLVMKNRDIEERAKKAYPIDGTNMMVGLIQRNSYILGATEQKAIDIEKACKWLKEQVYQEYGGGPCERLIPDTMIEEFRKAMEE